MAKKFDDLFMLWRGSFLPLPFPALTLSMLCVSDLKVKLYSASMQHVMVILRN